MDEILQLDNSVTGIPIATKLASSGYNVTFATYDEYLASQLKNYSPSIHIVDRKVFARLLMERRLSSTTEVEKVVPRSTTVLISAHGIGERVTERKALLSIVQKISSFLSPRTLLVYCGVSQPGTMEEIERIVDRFSRLKLNEDVHISMMTYPVINSDRYIVCSRSDVALEATIKLLSSLVPYEKIRRHEVFIEAEVANLTMLAERFMMKALSSYTILFSRRFGADPSNVLSMLDLNAPSYPIEDHISKMVLEYLSTEEFRIPKKLTLIKGARSTVRAYESMRMDLLKQRVKKSIPRKRGVQVTIILDRETKRSDLEAILPKRGISAEFIDLDGVLSRYEEGMRGLIPHKTSLVILAASSSSIPEGLLRELESTATLIEIEKL